MKSKQHQLLEKLKIGGAPDGAELVYETGLLNG